MSESIKIGCILILIGKPNKIKVQKILTTSPKRLEEGIILLIVSLIFSFSQTFTKIALELQAAGQQYCAKKVSCNYNDGLLHKKGAKCVSWDQRHCI